MKLIFLISLVSGVVWGAEVIKVGSDSRMVAVSHDVTRRWQLNDKLCVVKDGKEFACGNVIRVKENFCILRLKEGSESIARGDKVIASTPIKKPAILVEPEIVTSSLPITKEPFHLLTLSGTVGLSFLYPSLHFQRIVEPEFALGVMPSYLNINSSTKSLNSISILLTGNFYPKGFFKELWIMVAGGLAFMSSSTGSIEKQSTELQVLLTGGYRFKLDIGVVVGLAAGFQYLGDPEFSSLNLKGTGFKPLVLVDFGVNF